MTRRPGPTIMTSTPLLPKRVVLNPGDFHFGAAPMRLATLLGSCVTVTLWHPRRHIGGMCHILLPSRGGCPGGAPLDGHYADEAFILFDRALFKHASQPGEYQAKLFGGGDMFPNASTRTNLGEQNIIMARALLKQRNIPLLAEHAGGSGHRKLVFDLDTGEVQLYFANLNKALRGDS